MSALQFRYNLGSPSITRSMTASTGSSRRFAGFLPNNLHQFIVARFCNNRNAKSPLCLTDFASTNALIPPHCQNTITTTKPSNIAMSLFRYMMASSFTPVLSSSYEDKYCNMQQTVWPARNPEKTDELKKSQNIVFCLFSRTFCNEIWG